jgi:DNA-binding NarL/FixJ family response regulator
VVCAGIQRWGIRAALTAGAAGVVLYDDLDSALGPCLQAVQAGQTCVPRGHWRQIQPPALSSREKQILGLVVMGYMNSQIAEQLFLAESTVKSHLSSAFAKLGVRSRNEAVSLILDPERGLGIGILALGGEPLETVPTTAQ